jgi:hypothetical protein
LEAKTSTNLGHQRRWLGLLLFAACLLTAIYAWVVLTDAVPWLRGPKPWPPEWQWPYAPLSRSQAGRIGVQVGFLVAYLAVAALLMRLSGRRRVRGVLVLAVLFFALWQLIQTWVRDQSLLDTLIFRTYAPVLNGFFLAPAQVASVGETLRHYAAAMPDFFSDRALTHPPGLFLFYAVANGLFERLPQFSAWFAPVARSWALPGRDWPQLADFLVVSAFATSWVQVILTALAPLSLFGLLRALGSTTAPASGPRRIWGAETEPSDFVLWCILALPLISSLSLFFLQWDSVYLTLGLAAWWLAIRAQNRTWQGARLSPGAAVTWFLAGLVLSVLFWLSFGNVVWGGLIGLHVLWRSGVRWRLDRHPLALSAIAAGLALMVAAWALPWLLAYLAWGMRVTEITRVGLDLHYEVVTARRDYRLWLWMNPVDFSLWLGPAPLVLGLAGSLWLWSRTRSILSGDELPVSCPAPGVDLSLDLAGMAAAFWLTLIYLDLSGTTRGEVGRLWMFLMPFPVLFGLALPWRPRERWVILALLAAGSWVMAYAIAGITV